MEMAIFWFQTWRHCANSLLFKKYKCSRLPWICCILNLCRRTVASGFASPQRPSDCSPRPAKNQSTSVVSSHSRAPKKGSCKRGQPLPQLLLAYLLFARQHSRQQGVSMSVSKQRQIRLKATSSKATNMHEDSLDLGNEKPSEGQINKLWRLDDAGKSREHGIRSVR